LQVILTRADGAGEGKGGESHNDHRSPHGGGWWWLVVGIEIGYT
jgi:hypothetical protein